MAEFAQGNEYIAEVNRRLNVALCCLSLLLAAVVGWALYDRSTTTLHCFSVAGEPSYIYRPGVSPRPWASDGAWFVTTEHGTAMVGAHCVRP